MTQAHRFCFVFLFVFLSSLFLPLSYSIKDSRKGGTVREESLLQGQAGDGVALGRDAQSCAVEEGACWRG